MTAGKTAKTIVWVVKWMLRAEAVVVSAHLVWSARNEEIAAT